MMKELVVVSGKGGTGKTSVVASLADLAKPCVTVDCDVDAADLHLILRPETIRSGDFVGGAKAVVNASLCTACGRCETLCRFEAIRSDGPRNAASAKTFRVDPLGCEGCGVCVDHCEAKAIEMIDAVGGKWFVSETRCGPLVHARLGVAAENSGKLVTLIRRTAQEIAEERRADLIICDGSPGVGCPVIASLTGADLALFVVEPTVSGVHDFERVARLAARMGVPGLAAINKADLNAEMAEVVESVAAKYKIETVGRVPYDRTVTQSQIARKTVTEHSDGPASNALRSIWNAVSQRISGSAKKAVGNLIQLD